MSCVVVCDARARHGVNLLLAEGVEAGQNLWVVVVVQADAADQKLLVYLPHHRAGTATLALSHGERHSRPTQVDRWINWMV